MTQNINDNIPSTNDLASFHRTLSNRSLATNGNLSQALVELVEVMRGEMLEVWEYLHQRETLSPPTLRVKLLTPGARVPTRGSQHSIGLDLYADKPVNVDPGLHKLSLGPHGRYPVATGIAINVPQGYYGRVAPRSGLAAKQGVAILAGVIGQDFTGEIKVILHNTTDEIIIVDLQFPIAQLILERADIANVMIVEDLAITSRGAKGFGSSDEKGD